jgi:gas vesicle protein
MFKAILKFSEGLIIGAVGGYIAGLLCAPKSGRQLRAEISEQSEQLYEQASRTFDDLADTAAHTVHDMQSRAADTVHDIQSKATDTVHNMQSKTTYAVQDLQLKGEQLIRKAAINARNTGKRVADKFDSAFTQAVNSLVDENEIIGG